MLLWASGIAEHYVKLVFPLKIANQSNQIISDKLIILVTFFFDDRNQINLD